MSLIDAAGQKATINDDHFTRHEACGFGREKNRGATQLFYLPESFHRGAQKKFFAALSFVAHVAKSFPRSGDFGDQVVRRLTFTVEPGTNSDNVLLLRQNPILFQTSADEEENPLVLARNVKEFTLEFWGPRSKDWEPEWLYTNQLPKLIRFTLAFGRPNQRVLQPDDVITRVVALAAMPVPVGAQTAGGLQARPANPAIQPPPLNPGQPPGSTGSK